MMLAACVLLGSAGCGSDDGDAPPAAETDVTSTTQAAALPERMALIAEGLDFPTQIATGPEGVLLVAQLAGNENARTGEVIAVDLATGGQTVILSDLDKPTGLLWQDDALWIMVRTGLVRASWSAGDATAGPIEVVLEDLPFNGRSEGSLTALADGRFLYETSASVESTDTDAEGETHAVVTDGSATLWVFDPVARTSTAIATGTAGAYAHTVLDDGRIVTTEISDAFVGPPPVDELNVVALNGPAPNLGWPDCPADEECASVLGPAAVFPVAATPAGVAAIGTDVYVTLHVRGEIVRVSLAGWTPGAAATEPELVVDGLDTPLSMLVRPDGTIWISEHGSGRILSLTP